MTVLSIDLRLSVHEHCCSAHAHARWPFNARVITLLLLQLHPETMVKIHIIYYSTYVALATSKHARFSAVMLTSAHFFLTVTGTSSRWQKRWPPPSLCAPPFPSIVVKNPMLAPVHIASSLFALPQASGNEVAIYQVSSAARHKPPKHRSVTAPFSGARDSVRFRS